ncbi:MAG: PD-(D/E)XK nuclease-like domain-containing protein [Bacteroidota bacterium]
MPLDYGIHFGVPEEEYFAEQCLSTTALKQLLVSAKSYWLNSWMNPNPPEKEEKAHLDFGKLVHSYILEPETIDKYASEFVPPDDCLRTNDDLKEWLSDNAIKVKSGANKAALLDAVLAADPDAPILEALQRQFYNASPDKIFVSAELYEKLPVMQDWINCETEIFDIFSNGMPEVTMICKCPITGEKIKARIDWLTLHMADLKTFAIKSKLPIDQVCVSAFRNERYDIQFYVYDLVKRTVFEALKNKDKAYKITGEHNPEWLEYIIQNSNDRFYFTFIESTVPYNVKILDIERWRKQDEEHNQLFEHAANSYEKAISKYQYCMNKFGPNQIWRDDPMVHVTDKDMPLYFFTN